MLDYTEDSVSVNNTSHMLPAKTTQMTLSLPVMVLPIEAQNKSSLPIVAQYNKISMRGNNFLLGLLGLYKQCTRSIDSGKYERTTGVSYVDIGRVKSLASCVKEPMTCEQ